MIAVVFISLHQTPHKFSASLKGHFLEQYLHTKKLLYIPVKVDLPGFQPINVV